MLIPVSRAYSTEYSKDVMMCRGSQMNGYSRALIPSADAAHAQPTCTSRASSQAILLTGRLSTRAAIWPGMTRVVPPTAPLPPGTSSAIAVPPWCHPASCAAPAAMRVGISAVLCLARPAGGSGAGP
jgi:hypothetical protein